MEILDIVNESDVVVGSASREEIHQRGLVHRAVHILVFNSAHELFLQQRSWQKDADPGLWDSSCAGHVESGESYTDCAVREVEEELGLVINPADLHPLFKMHPLPETGMEFAMIYRLVSDQPMKLDPEEIIAGRWASHQSMEKLTDADDPELTNAIKLIWRRYRSETSES